MNSFRFPNLQAWPRSQSGLEQHQSVHPHSLRWRTSEGRRGLDSLASTFATSQPWPFVRCHVLSDVPQPSVVQPHALVVRVVHELSRSPFFFPLVLPANAAHKRLFLQHGVVQLCAKFLDVVPDSANSSSPALPFGCGLQPSPHWLFEPFPWIPCPRGSGEPPCCPCRPCLQRQKLVEFWRALGCQLLGTKKNRNNLQSATNLPRIRIFPKKSSSDSFAQRAPNFRWQKIMSSNCHDFDPEHASGLCIQYDALPHHTSQPSSAEKLCLGKKITKDVGFWSHWKRPCLIIFHDLAAPVVTLFLGLMGCLRTFAVPVSHFICKGNALSRPQHDK